MTFYNRIEELHFLQEHYETGKPELIVLYGRRRVGKTEVIKEFIKDKEAIYFLSDKEGSKNNFERFVEKVNELTKQVGITFKGWTEAFVYLKKENRRIVIAVDEFPYLLQSDPPLTSLFQRIADEILPHSLLYIILCGSSVSVMEDKVLAYRSPLYGRRTGQWQLDPLWFTEASLFFPRYAVAEKIEAYAIAGGIPLYLAQIHDDLSIGENLHKHFFSKGTLLYQEPLFVLNQEFSDARIYFSLLQAISQGKNTIKEISDTTSMDPRNVNKYLNLLLRLHYIAKTYPVFYEKNKKRARYHLKDNFFNFWFTFISPHLSELEMGNLPLVEKKVKPLFNSFVGKSFEQVTEEILLTLNKKEKLPFSLDVLGNFWDTTKEKETVEIDRIGMNKKEKKLLVVECKWKEMVSPEKLLQETKEKVAKIHLFQGYAVFYAFFAKSFSGSMPSSTALLFDLK